MEIMRGPGQVEGRDQAAARREKIAQPIGAELRRPQTPLPQTELDLQEQFALGNTGQSRSVRHLLFPLPGAAAPTGFQGDGLLELRRLAVLRPL